MVCEPYAGGPWDTDMVVAVKTVHVHFSSNVIVGGVRKHVSIRACQSVRWGGYRLCEVWCLGLVHTFVEHFRLLVNVV